MKRWLLTIILLLAVWVPLDEDGYIWQLRHTHPNKTQTVIGECYYTRMKINGREIWRGKFFEKKTDFDHKDMPFEEESDCLADCVQWVEMMALGGYYL